MVVQLLHDQSDLGNASPLRKIQQTDSQHLPGVVGMFQLFDASGNRYQRKWRKIEIIIVGRKMFSAVLDGPIRLRAVGLFLLILKWNGRRRI
jgi:hypothetical protein